MARPQMQMISQQPDASTVLQLPDTPPVINDAAIAAVGAKLQGRFRQYEMDRRVLELKWERNARQYLGVYDPDIERVMDVNRSRAYPKLTRVKCVSMLARLMNLLFPADDKNWTVEPSAVPNLSEEDLQTVLDSLQPAAPATPTMGAPGAMPAAPQTAAPPTLTDDQIEQAVRDFAKKKSERMEREIEDQLQEIGGDRSLNYVALCRKVLSSGIQYGAGILKGPFVAEEVQRTWTQDSTGKYVPQPVVKYRPRFEFVSIWDYYPDLSARALFQMEGQFERIVMTKHQVIMLKQRPDFIAAQIDKFLRQSPTGNYVRRAYETELRAMGPQLNVTHQERNKFEVIVWEGYVSGTELANCGVAVEDKLLEQDVRAQVWLLGDIVIKAQIDPWSKLLTDGDMPQYHHFIFEDDESCLLGNGLPNIVRDSQMGLCAVTRMCLDNASIQRVTELNISLLSPNNDTQSIGPDKIFIREDTDVSTMSVPAVRQVDYPMHITEMMSIGKMFQDLADQETFVGPATGGDMSKGPSEPFRTASGASMLRGDAALPFKDVVRNYDAFTESVIGAILNFNKVYNPDDALTGDFQPVARGATSLIAKEVLGIQLDSMTTTLTDQEKQYIKWPQLLRAKVRVRDLQVEDIVMDDAACAQVDQQTAATAQAQAAATAALNQATVRETLAGALKDLAQAGKNSAAAQATSAKVILDSLNKGVNPDALTPPTGADDGGIQGNPPAASPQGGAAMPGGDALGTGFGSDATLPIPAGNPAAGPAGGAAAMPRG